MKKKIVEVIKQYVSEMIAFQPEYEYGCEERGLHPKTTYERIYNALYDATWMEEYMSKNGVNTSDFESWYSIFLEVRKEISIQELIDDCLRE